MGLLVARRVGSTADSNFQFPAVLAVLAVEPNPKSPPHPSVFAPRSRKLYLLKKGCQYIQIVQSRKQSRGGQRRRRRGFDRGGHGGLNAAVDIHSVPWLPPALQLEISGRKAARRRRLAAAPVPLMGTRLFKHMVPLDGIPPGALRRKEMLYFQLMKAAKEHLSRCCFFI